MDVNLGKSIWMQPSVIFPVEMLSAHLAIMMSLVMHGPSVLRILPAHLNLLALIHDLNDVKVLVLCPVAFSAVKLGDLR